MASFSFFVVLVLAIIRPSGATRAIEAELDSQSVVRGKAVFDKSGCFVCHGNEGIGGVRNKNSATGEKIPSLTYVSRGFDDQALKQKILQGSTAIRKLDLNGPMPPVSMPSFKKLISENELTDLAAYLRSLAPEEDEEPRPVSEVRPLVPEYMLAKDACNLCHGLVTERFKANLHYATSPVNKFVQNGAVCISCHGEGTNHARKYGDPSELLLFTRDSPLPVEKKNDACLQCHQRGAVAHWVGSQHGSKDIACVDCHKIMESAPVPKLLASQNEQEICSQCHRQQTARMFRSSHMPIREGKIRCSDCHNPHGSPSENMLIEASVNENCYRCHAEKRGPFLWEHPPVAENCADCHQVHGSHYDKLLTVSMPRLCQRCHIGSEVHATTPQLATSRFVFNRSCMNCHAQIHGSNHPSGMRFHR